MVPDTKVTTAMINDMDKARIGILMADVIAENTKTTDRMDKESKPRRTAESSMMVNGILGSL